MADPWSIMGLPRSATQEQIKEQWRRLCKQYHPDLQSSGERAAAEQRFKSISGAYRTLTSRGSSLSGWADYNVAAAAAAAGRGHPHHAYGAGFRSAWAPGGQHARFSNGVVGAVLFIPLVITGMWMALTFHGTDETPWRPHGLLGPPENPFLREDMKPRVKSHIRNWAEARRREEEQAAAAAAAAAVPAGLQAGAAVLPRAAAAAAAVGTQ